MERCFIGTIHSFCASLLRERPVEASVDPDFTELDDITDMLLHKQAWQQYLLDVRLNFPEKLAKLNNCGLKPSDLENIYSRLHSTLTLKLFLMKFRNRISPGI
jgi:ATP-dependent helicase/nuclease subunit A